jgi:hypothetical protein
MYKLERFLRMGLNINRLHGWLEIMIQCANEARFSRWYVLVMN